MLQVFTVPVPVFVEQSAWERVIWQISLPHWWEFIVRAFVVYGFLLVILRLTGKRQIGQMAPFDLVLLLILSNAVQNSMNGGDNSITGGLILSTTLVAINSAVSWLTYRSRWWEAVIEGRPSILIHDGKIDHVSMRKAKLTTHELEASLRSAGCAGPAEVRYAVLENSGKISVIRKDTEHDILTMLGTISEKSSEDGSADTATRQQ